MHEATVGIMATAMLLCGIPVVGVAIAIITAWEHLRLTPVSADAVSHDSPLDG